MTDVVQDGSAASALRSAADGGAMPNEMQRTVLRYAAIMALVSVGCPEELRDGPLAVTDLAGR